MKEEKKEGKKRRKERKKGRKEGKKEGRKEEKKEEKKKERRGGRKEVVGKKIGTEEKIETPALCRKFFSIFYETEITIRSTLVRASSNGKFSFRMCCF